MHEFCSHCDVRKTSLFEINQQLGDQMENLRAENENLRSQLRYYESSDLVDIVRCKDCAVPHNRWTGCPKLNGLVTPSDFYCAFGERSKEVEDAQTF